MPRPKPWKAPSEARHARRGLLAITPARVLFKLSRSPRARARRRQKPPVHPRWYLHLSIELVLHVRQRPTIHQRYYFPLPARTPSPFLRGLLRPFYGHCCSPFLEPDLRVGLLLFVLPDFLFLTTRVIET